MRLAWLGTALSLVAVGTIAPSAVGSITVAGVTFDDDNAFVDKLIGYSGIVGYEGISGGNKTGVPVADAVLGSDVNSWGEFDTASTSFLQLGFLDNAAVNGDGNDLAIFEIGPAESPSVALVLNGTTVVVPLAYSGYSNYRGIINVGYVDLDDFGIAAGAVISSVVVYRTGTNTPDIAAVGALNSVYVPEPTALVVWSLLGCLGVGLAWWHRRDA